MKIKICGIYCITNKINGKKYIGQSVDIYRRWAQEKKMKRLNEHLLRSMQKYGVDNFDFQILQECSPEDLNALEVKYVELYKTTLPQFGYNKTTGGDSEFHRTFRPMSQEQKDKISKANKGRKPSKEEIEHLKQANIDRSKSMKPVFCYETNQVYESCANAARTLGLSVDCVRRCASNKQVSTKDQYHFCYANDKDTFVPDLRNVKERTKESLKKVDRSNYVVSEETRKKLRECQLGRKKSPEEIEKLRKANIGKTLSEETKQKIKDHARHGSITEEHKKAISEASKKRVRERGICKKVYCIETGIVYDSISEAAKKTNVGDDTLVSRCCRGKQKTAKGLHFKFV